MWQIDELCQYLRELDRNKTLLELWNSTTEPTTLRGIDREHAHYDYDPWTDEPGDALNFNDSLKNATESKWYDIILDITHSKFRELTEWYVIPGAATLGILSNVWALVLLMNFSTMRRNSSKLHGVMLVVDTFYLGLCLAFTQLRHHGLPWQNKIEIMQYFTMTLSIFQFLSLWVLYVAATDAYRYFNSFRKATSLLKLAKTPRNMCLAFLGALVLHVPFVPPIRILVWEADITPHDPCTSPIENHWNYIIDDVPTSDLFYVLYFTLVYYLLWYAWSCFLIGCRDKDILDCLQTMQERHGLPLIALQAGHTCFMMSALCNVTLVCIIPKLALMTFKMFEFAVHYLHGAHEYFLYFNDVANLMQVIRAGVYLPILFKYSPYSRAVLRRVCCTACRYYDNRSKEKKDVPIIKVNEV